MFSRFKGLMTLFAILCVAAIAGGSAYFYFGGKASDEKSISNKAEGTDNTGGVVADNILENYEFGSDKDLNETYTYYFFPSTLYMTDDFFYSGIMPETVFGYNEVILDDNGDPVLDSNGQPQYKIVKDNIVGMKENTTYYDYLVNVLNDQESSYLADGKYASLDYPDTTREVLYSGSWDNPNYYYYYQHAYFRDPYVINNPYIVDYLSHENDFNPNGNDYYTTNATATKSFLFGNTNYYLYFYMHNGKYTGEVDADVLGNVNNVSTILNGIAGSYTSKFKKSTEVLSPIYADSESVDISNYRYGIDLEFTDANRSVINTFLDSEGTNIKLNDEEDDDYNNNMMGRSQYRNDRFGFWSPFYDLDDPNNEDFYIENPNLANRYLPIKITVNGNLTPDDMAKVIPTLSASMFDSNMWFDFSANVWTYVPYANNAYSFGSKEYTTATGGFTAKDIKNIFDIMQNPSKYADKDGNIRLFPVFSNGKNSGATSVSDGGGDAVQASFSYVNDSSNIENDILPSSTKLTWSSYSYSGASNGFYDNYSVNYAVLNNVEIKKEKFKSITFKIDTTYFDGEPHWGGFWIDVYKLEASTIDEFVTTYGEGLYTFYFFLGNRGNNTSLSNEMAFPNVKNKSLIENVVSYNDSSNELAHKYLLNIEEPKWAQTDKGQGDQGNGSSVNTPNYSRPVALAVEKVTNLRLVSDIPIAEDENGLPSANQDWDSIDGNIQQGLLNAKNFTIADEVYGFADNIYNEDNIDLSSGKRLDTSNPYSYFIQNADFRFVNNLYFQIRFSNDYINDAMNVTTDYSRIKGKKPDKYVAYSINNQVLKFKFQDSDDGDVFIENATAGSGTDVRQGFKLKDYNARGIYDILLISHETAGYIGTWTGTVGSDNIELVINDDGTLLYNDEPYTYTVDENTIKAVDESESCQLTIIYNETTKSLNVTWKDLYNTYYGELTDFVYKQQYYMYVNRHTNSFIKLFKGNPGTFEFEAEGTNEATNNFVSHKLPSEVSEEEKKDPIKDPTRDENSSLIWNGQTYLGEYLSASTTGLSYGAKGVDGEETLLNNSESFIDAIKRTIGVTPGLDNIYPIYDCVTGQQIAYYNSGVGRLFTSFGSSDGVSSDLNLFTIMKNYVLYIGEPISRVL